MNPRDLIADQCNVPELLAELDKLMALMPASNSAKPIDPPFHAVTPDNPSQEANGVAALPFVATDTGD